MRPENCVTRNHISVWHERVLPPAPERITFWTVLRGSLLPILVWACIVCGASLVYDPAVAMALGGLFTLSLVVGFVRRRRSTHSVRCSVYGALGGVLDKSMAGF
ncbi:hypothetical protein ACH4SP_07195 [Streptomyces sp. NPDC021093]|uniref:hypothetical protein n=1 Tax=Streptomyces sp. NPDC021093 TaxID=3365112 RepID=UPI0037AEA358